MNRSFRRAELYEALLSKRGDWASLLMPWIPSFLHQNDGRQPQPKILTLPENNSSLPEKAETIKNTISISG